MREEMTAPSVVTDAKTTGGVGRVARVIGAVVEF